METQKHAPRRNLVWVPLEQMAIIKEALRRWPYKKKAEIVREALVAYAEKHEIPWKEVTA